MAYLSGDRHTFLRQLDDGSLGAIDDKSLFAEVAADLVDEGVIVATRREQGEWGMWTMYAPAVAPRAAREDG